MNDKLISGMDTLISIKLSKHTYNYDYVHCKSIQHCQDIDYLCLSIINNCLESGVLAIPFVCLRTVIYRD